jgi:hypothetical protein
MLCLRESAWEAKKPLRDVGLLPGAADHLDAVAVRVVAFAELNRHTRPRQTGPLPPLAEDASDADPSGMEERVIERAEVVALLFNVSDIASSLDRIEQLLGEDDGEEEADGS